MSLGTLINNVRNKSGYKADPVYSTDWFSNHIDNWSQWLGKLKGKADLQFLEIGSFEGRSTRWLLDNILTHPVSHIYCIDVFELFNMDMEAVRERFEYNIKPYQEKVSL